MAEVSTNDATIYYEVSGNGPAVLLAHGAGGNRLSWWQQEPVLAARYTVIRMDHRGFGRSRCADSAFHPMHFAGDALAILDAVGVERAAIVGQSMGGWTAVRTALAAPDRIACLVLAGTPGGIATPLVIEAVGQVGRRVADSGIQGNAALAPDYPSREPAMAFLYDQINALNTAVDPAWLGRLFDPEGRVDPASVRDWAVPTLFIHGDQDQLFPPDAIADVASHLPGAERICLSGVGHSTYFEAAGDFNERVTAFLGEHVS